MEHMDAMVDLVRALSKKCEDYERQKDNAESYYRWYREAQEELNSRKEEVDRLREILQNAGIDH